MYRNVSISWQTKNRVWSPKILFFFGTNEPYTGFIKDSGILNGMSDVPLSNKIYFYGKLLAAQFIFQIIYSDW